MKKIVSLFLCFVLIASCFAACSKTSNELTEENVTATVEEVTNALKEFDPDVLGKYVESSILQIIIGYAEKKQQFADLGKAIFADLSLEIESIDLENQTVTVSAYNKELTNVARDFAANLKSEYNTIQLLRLLSDDEFLNTKLAELTENIAAAQMQEEKTSITLNVKQGDKNLVLCFDDDDENIVSGGALDAIKAIYTN